MKKKGKVYIIEEIEEEIREKKPVNFQPWFFCTENWDRLPVTNFENLKNIEISSKYES